jgi:lipopolysaccharide/colanic/teichoic acid biosynthesis glycosyltransferase
MWLRRTGLDASPSFSNVPRGELSACGPRSRPPDDVSHHQPWQVGGWCRLEAEAQAHPDIH